MSQQQLAERLDEVAMLSAEPDFEGATWLGRLTMEFWKAGQDDFGEQYGGLIRLLYDIGFIGCGVARGRTLYTYNEPGYLDRLNKIRTCDKYTLHHAFRSALDSVVPNTRGGDRVTS